MDIEKARDAHLLYIRRSDLRSSIITMRSRFENNHFGTTNLTVPTSWLPEIVKIAEAELSDIDEAIAKL